MTDEQIRQYVAAQQNVNDDLAGMDGFFDKLKNVVKKAVVVVATVKGGPMGKKLADKLINKKKGAPSEEAAVIRQAGDEAVSQNIPRAVGVKAAKSFFTPKNIAIGSAALIGVGGLVYFLSRKRGR